MSTYSRARRCVKTTTMATSMLNHLNNLLPATHQIDPTYVKAIKAEGFSDQLQQHAILDRLEARLRTLDGKKDGKIVRSWEGTWASDVLETPEYAAFQGPFEDAEGRRTAGGQKRKHFSKSLKKHPSIEFH